MPTEYKLSYTANKIGEQLRKVDNNAEEISKLQNELVAEHKEHFVSENGQEHKAKTHKKSKKSKT